ncbi:MAG: sulfatase-like hydrolase/transferase [Candidatus Magnetomorum sp.]|nr:sulfatase-like hydrolase/transferase [Candidatus Magnetomorum sp.]
MNRYTTFIDDSQKNFKLIFFCALIMLTYRIVLMIRFSIYFTEPLTVFDYLLALYVGFCFDISLGAYVALLPFLLSSICLIHPFPTISRLSRQFMLIFFSTLNAIILLANYLFFLEYEDNFNQWIFGVLYDDFSAVLSTTWKTFPVFSLSCIVLVATLISVYIGLHFINRPFYSFHHHKTLHRPIPIIGVLICIFFLFFLTLRGSIHSRPIQLKDAGVTRDAMLNKMVVNPYFALRFVIKQFFLLSKANGINLYIQENDIQHAAERHFGKMVSGNNLDEYMKKTARGIQPKKPRHVFLFVMESFDAWPLLDAYQSFDVMPNMRKLGQEGLLVTNFLSSGTGTMTSLSSMITGLPDVGVITNYQISARKPFPTSLAPQLKRLNYQCNMYYGGYLSWQRIGDFCKDQGFDHVFGGGHMGRWPINEWGVDDQQIFEYIDKNFDISQDSFNLILSTSNHPPYDIPVYQMGFPFKEIPDDLKEEYDATWSLKIFGHIWYSDKVLGEFIDRISQKAPDALFIVTGDHWSRKFLNPRPNLMIRSSVPLLIYSKQGLPESLQAAKLSGAHLNILPTIIEYCAPRGFEYFSMCQDIFDKNYFPLGIGRSCLITPCDIWNSEGQHHQISLNCEHPVFTSEQAIKRIKDMYGIGWWRLMKGPLF